MKINSIKNDFKYIDLLKPKHLSFYSLILEDNTCLKAQKYVEEDEEVVVEQYNYIYSELETFIKNVDENFDISPTERFFVDYELPTKKYANGDWGKNRPLTTNEKEKYSELFSKIGVTDMDKVRLVEYCWYNCSEAPDYYDEASGDDFYKEV